MFAYFKIKETDLIYLKCCFFLKSPIADNYYRLSCGCGSGLLENTYTMEMVRVEGKRREDGEQLLTDRLIILDQGVTNCYNRKPKSELGASQPDRLGKMMLAGGEGKGREMVSNR